MWLGVRVRGRGGVRVRGGFGVSVGVGMWLGVRGVRVGVGLE